MATTTSLPAPEAQSSIGTFGRITGVFFSPKATFEDIVRKPSWAAPVMLLTLLSLLVSVAINQRVNWREFMIQQIEKSPGAANMSADQREQRIEGGMKISPIITYVIGVCGPILATVIVTLVMWGGYNLLGATNTNFATAIGITSHAFLTGLVSSPLLILILYLKPIVGSILPDDSAKWLMALGKSIDLFSFWTLILLAIGFACTNPRKLKGGKAYTIAFSIWAAFVVLKVGWAFIFS
jgi:Yip1 domain